MLGYFVLLLDLSVVINVFFMTYVSKPGSVSKSLSLNYSLILPKPILYIGEIFSLMQMQIYFLQLMQYTNEQRRRKEGPKLITTSHITLFIYVLAFGLIGFFSY
jgi:hypothetical protein